MYIGEGSMPLIDFIDWVGPPLGFLVFDLQPLSLLLRDGRLVDLKRSAEKDSSGKDLKVSAEEGEATKAMEACRVSKEEKLGSVSLPDNLVKFSSFLGLPMVGVEKEINYLLRKLESRKGHGVKVAGGKRNLFLATQLEREI